jgi:2-polyprenyl-3-methyl-5-hydroxy-6-metoxy-1,4-benzoquinol methylase
MNAMSPPVSKAPRRYRQRVYDEYVSAFKGGRSQVTAAEEFERHARFLDHLCGPAAEPLGRDARILEVACGQGRFLFWARSRGFSNVRGFDVSAEQVEIARALGLPAEVAAADTYLSGCGCEFDLVVAMDIVEHFTRDEALEFLAKCCAALRPGGTLFLTTPNGAGLRPGPVASGDLTHETIFSPQTIRLALRLSGFDRIEVREVAPAPLSIRSVARRVLWAGARGLAMLIDLIETGRTCEAYSRVMAVRACRKDRP